MNTRSFWELSGKSKLPPRSDSSVEAVEPHLKEGAIKFFFQGGEHNTPDTQNTLN